MTPFDPTPVHHTEGGHQFSNVFRPGKEGEPRKLLARFFGNDHKTNAQEFCDLFTTYAGILRERKRDGLPISPEDFIETTLKPGNTKMWPLGEEPNPIDTARGFIDMVNDAASDDHLDDCFRHEDR